MGRWLAGAEHDRSNRSIDASHWCRRVSQTGERRVSEVGSIPRVSDPGTSPSRARASPTPTEGRHTEGGPRRSSVGLDFAAEEGAQIQTLQPSGSQAAANLQAMLQMAGFRGTRDLPAELMSDEDLIQLFGARIEGFIEERVIQLKMEHQEQIKAGIGGCPVASTSTLGPLLARLSAVTDALPLESS